WVARSGQSAIKKVEYSQPDLILLDVLMPGMDGFETCLHLKASESTRDIPVIFMTALADTENKVKGFNAGAVDYITKPFQQEEVLARVQTHLSIRNLTKKLQVQNEQLQQEITERNQLANELEKRVEERTVELSKTNSRLQQEIEERCLAEQTLQRSLVKLQQAQSQLIQSEKMSAIGQMVAGVAHEINNPVNFIYGNLSHVSDDIEELLEMLNLYQEVYPNPEPKISKKAEDIDLGFLIEDLPKMLNSMQVGAERIRDIVLSLRRFSHQDGFEMKPMNIHEGIDSTLMILHNRLKFKPDRPAIEIIKEYSSNLPLVECYGGELNQVFMNILANAIDAIDESNQHRSAEQIKAYPSWIWINTQVTEGNRVIIRIKDNGSGITPEVTQHIFDPFYTTKSPGKGTGIGLSISWQIVVEKHGGSLQCNSTPAQGTEFVIELPIAQGYQAMIAS
ncbi:MAG TPA: ATP-binding protein, partial [Phormidium sp.]